MLNKKNTSVGTEDDRLQLQNMSGRDNTCADLLSRIHKRLQKESVGVGLRVDDRAYLIGVIYCNCLKKRRVLETDKDKDIQVVTDSIWTDEIEREHEDTEITALRERERIDEGETSRYTLHEVGLYYLSGRDKEVRLRLCVPGDIFKKCHEKLGHIGIEKTYDLIRRNY